MEISGFQQLKQDLKHIPPKAAVVAAAHEEHTLQAVRKAQEDGLIRPVLVGDAAEIQKLTQAMGWQVPEEDVVDEKDEAGCARRAVELIRQGRGSLLIKGMIQTGTLLKEVVRHGTGIRESAVLSHVAILDVPAYHKLMFITDGGMVVAPDLEQKRAILNNALGLCRFLGYDQPKAAVLCAVETVNPKMQETVDAAALNEEGAARSLWRLSGGGAHLFGSGHRPGGGSHQGIPQPGSRRCGYFPGAQYHRRQLVG